MNAHDWYIENQAAYIARALERQEEELFEDHLPRCENCRKAIEEIERDLSWLPMAVRPVAPRPGFTRQITVAVLDHEIRPLWRRVMQPLAIAAMLALAVGLGLVTRHSAQLESTLLVTRERLDALSDTLGVMQRAQHIMQTTIKGDGYEGGMFIFADNSTKRWKVVVHGIPAAPVGEAYHFWFICPDGLVKGAEVNVDPTHPAILTLTLPEDFGPVYGASLTMESLTNVSSTPKGKELAHLRL